MKTRAILFEAAAGSEFGMGHLGRCKELAIALAAMGYRPCFRLFGTTDYSLAQPFQPAGEQTRFAAAVIDRYAATRTYIRSLRQSCGTTVVFDDLADRPVDADIVVNPNYYGQSLDFSGYSYATLLAGPSYAQIPREIVALRDLPAGNEVLITFGLSKLSALIPPLACRIARFFPGRTIRGIVPAQFRYAYHLPDNVHLIEPGPFAKLLKRSDLVISGLGVSWQEAVAAGRRVVGVRLAPNQDLMHRAVLKDGFPVSASPDEEAVVAALEKLSETDHVIFETLKTTIDGKGPERVAAAIDACILAAKSNDD